MRRGEASTRIDGRYFALREVIMSPYPLVEFGTLVTMEPDYGLSSRAVTRTSETEPRYIRITDFGEDGIAPGHEFVTAESWEAGYKLGHDDILFARSGSVGKTYLHEDTSEPAVFAGYCIRFKFDASKVMPRFVYWWTKTAAYSRWVEAIQRPSVQSNINKEEFKGCLIPLPPILEQERLVTRMESARAERKAKLAEADALLAGIDGFLLDALGMAAPVDDGRRVFAVRRGDVGELSINPPAYVPELRHYLNGLRSNPAVTKTLSAYVEVNPRLDTSKLDADSVVGFIPMQAVADGATGEYTVTPRLLGEVSKGYTPFINGDILWAKITPCMQNGKSCLVDGLPNDIGFGSTEFHVLRVRAAGISGEFVREFVSQATLRRVSTYAFTGSAGQQRVPAAFLENLPFPELPVERQNEIVATIEARRLEARRLRGEAEAGWEGAKGWFEKELLGADYATQEESKGAPTGQTHAGTD